MKFIIVLFCIMISSVSAYYCGESIGFQDEGVKFNITVPGKGEYTVELSDSYGDGWNGNVLSYGDKNMTIESGSFANYTINVTSLPLEMEFSVQGSYTGEVSFIVDCGCMENMTYDLTLEKCITDCLNGEIYDVDSSACICDLNNKFYGSAGSCEGCGLYYDLNSNNNGCDAKIDDSIGVPGYSSVKQILQYNNHDGTDKVVDKQELNRIEAELKKQGGCS